MATCPIPATDYGKTLEEDYKTLFNSLVERRRFLIICLSNGNYEAQLPTLSS